jgi:hypothetical protein
MGTAIVNRRLIVDADMTQVAIPKLFASVEGPVWAEFAIAVGHDRFAELAVYYQGVGTWAVASSWPKSASGINNITTGYAVAFGSSNVVNPVPADYGGNGHADLAFYYPQTGDWFYATQWSETGSYGTPGSVNQSASFVVQWGSGAVVPVPADYTGSGHAELAYYNPSNGQWLFGFSWTPGTLTSPGPVTAYGSLFVNSGEEDPLPGSYYVGDSGDPRATNVTIYSVGGTPDAYTRLSGGATYSIYQVGNTDLGGDGPFSLAESLMNALAGSATSLAIASSPLRPPGASVLSLPKGPRALRSLIASDMTTESALPPIPIPDRIADKERSINKIWS